MRLVLRFFMLVVLILLVGQGEGFAMDKQAATSENSVTKGLPQQPGAALLNHVQLTVPAAHEPFSPPFLLLLLTTIIPLLRAFSSVSNYVPQLDLLRHQKIRQLIFPFHSFD